MQVESKNARAIVAPHAGYSFSGIASAVAYSFLKNTKIRRFVIIGPNHTGIGPDISVYPSGYWETPLGKVKVDEELSEIFKEYHDTSAHEYEHSIEVQLPFLQYIFDDFTFLPIMVMKPENLQVIANKIPKDVGVIASSDFTHYGPAYGYTPFEENVRELVKQMDLKAIKHIIELDDRSFIKHVVDYNATICGFVPITIMIKWLKQRNVNGELLIYYNSGDVIGDYENFVAYAAIGFEDRE